MSEPARAGHAPYMSVWPVKRVFEPFTWFSPSGCTNTPACPLRGVARVFDVWHEQRLARCDQTYVGDRAEIFAERVSPD